MTNNTDTREISWDTQCVYKITYKALRVNTVRKHRKEVFFASVHTKERVFLYGRESGGHNEDIG